MKQFILFAIMSMAVLPRGFAAGVCEDIFSNSSMQPEDVLIPLKQHWDNQSSLQKLESFLLKEKNMGLTDVKPQKPLATLEPISQKAEETIEYIINQKINSANFDKSTLLNLFSARLKEDGFVIPNSPIAPGLAMINLRFLSESAVKSYFKDLLTQTFQNMQKSPSPEVRNKAVRGEIDHNTIVETLKQRLAARGIRTIKISYKKELSPWIFRHITWLGAPIDWGFQYQDPKGYYSAIQFHHGVYTHLIQFDMISDILIDYSPTKNPREFLNFFRTKNGNKYWLVTFDGNGATASGEGITNPFFVSKLAAYMRLRTPNEESRLKEEYIEKLHGSDFNFSDPRTIPNSLTR